VVILCGDWRISCFFLGVYFREHGFGVSELRRGRWRCRRVGKYEGARLRGSRGIMNLFVRF